MIASLFPNGLLEPKENEKRRGKGKNVERGTKIISSKFTQNKLLTSTDLGNKPTTQFLMTKSDHYMHHCWNRNPLRKMSYNRKGNRSDGNNNKSW